VEAGTSSAEILRNPVHTAAIGHVVKRLLDEAERLYQRAETGVSSLPRDSRVAILAARLIYSAIGNVIARNRHDAISQRASTGRLLKFWLLLRALVRPARSLPPLSMEPPLDEVAFLVRGHMPPGLLQAQQ
jgi:15-cis-phytoene synthase